VERHLFEFDHVFGVGAKQEHVFEEVSQLVQVLLCEFFKTVFRAYAKNSRLAKIGVYVGRHIPSRLKISA
jgi:hypothetical protein